MDFPLDKQQRKEQRNAEETHNIRAGSASHIRRATLISMIGMILAKLTGFFRELLIVPKFGYGLYSDAYINAFQIPDLVYELLVGGVVAAVLTPTLSAGIERGRQKSTWHSVSVFITVTLLITSIALLLAEIFAAPLLAMITGAFAEDASPELVQMTRIAVPITRILLFQSILMISVSLLHGILSSYKRFTPVALGPSLYNTVYIIALVLFGEASASGVRNVALGVVLAAFVYFLYQAFSARRELRYFRFSLDIHDRGFRRLVQLAIPTLISGSVLHLSSILMNLFANGLNMPGAVTAIRQCMTTWGLPYAIFAVSVGNVMLPNISGIYELNEAKRVRSLYTSSLRRALYFVIPVALAFAIMNFETIQAIFQWDPQAYTDSQVMATASALRWFCASIVAQTVVFITNQAFYARKITKIALFTGLIALAMNPFFLYIYVNILNKGLSGIGMAHASYSTLTALIIFSLYKRHRKDMRPYRLFPFILRVAFCATVSGVFMHSMNALPIFPDKKLLQLFLYAIKFLGGLFAYYVAGLSIRLREALLLQEAIRRLFGLPQISKPKV